MKLQAFDFNDLQQKTRNKDQYKSSQQYIVNGASDHPIPPNRAIKDCALLKTIHVVTTS